MESDKATHQYKKDSTFENAVDLYYFDKELRAIIFSTIQSIEVAVRSKIIHNVSMKLGAFWFLEEGNFNNSSIFNKNMVRIKEEISRSKEDFIQGHYSKYDNPILPPAWKTLEVTSLGTLSKLYSNLNDKMAKRIVARELGLPQHLYLEKAIHPDTNFIERFKSLLLTYPNADIAAMGFPANWEDEPLWLSKK